MPLRAIWCVALALVIPLAPTAFADPAIRYELQRDPSGAAVGVTCVFAGDPSGASIVSVEGEWGGTFTDPQEFSALTAAGDAGRLLPVTHGEKCTWTIAHNPGETVTLHYALVEPAAREPLGPGHNDYRTRVRPDLFQMIGNHGLLYPQHLCDGQPREHQVTWSGFDQPGFHALSSFGTGVTQSVTLDEPRFRQSLFIAGKLSYIEETIHGARVGLVISGDDWGFTPRQFADLAFHIITVERDFFADHSDPWYLVSVTPEGHVGAHGFTLGGTALTNCFALYCNAGISLDPASGHVEQIRHVLAHEYFHTWNGNKFHIDGPEGSNYWFSEGFTEYFTRRMLRLAGLWDNASVLADINRSLSEYDTNPRKNAPGADIQAHFWTDQDISRLPYRRGDLLALALDDEIRRVSSGKRSLDDVFRELIRSHPAGSPMPDRQAVLSVFERETSKDFIDALRRSIDDGQDPPLPATLTEFNLSLGSSSMRSFDPGFDTQASKTGRRLVGVKPGSGAAEAGLKDGLPLRRASISSSADPGQAPKGEVEVEIDGDWMKIEYEAIGPVQSVRSYK